MSWFAGKLGHELQDFVEAERSRLGVQGIDIDTARQIIKLKLRLILSSLLESDLNPKNVEYLRVVERLHFHLLEPDDTCKSVGEELHGLEKNPFRFYNTFEPLEDQNLKFVWHFLQSKYVLMPLREAEEYEREIKEAKSKLGTNLEATKESVGGLGILKSKGASSGA